MTLNANGGSGGTGSVTATFDAMLPSITKPTRSGYTFIGYFDTSASTGGTQYYNSNGTGITLWQKTSNGTLYARWSANPVSCQASKYYNGTSHVPCPQGYYCPGTGQTTEGNAGCSVSCDSGYSTSGTGASAATQCTKSCSVNCITTGGCPANSQTCTFDTTVASTGTMNQVNKTCSVSAPACPAKTISCKSSYYAKGSSNNYTCASCESLPGGYTLSLLGNATEKQGTGACYKSCTNSCTKPTCTTANATCTYSSETYKGGSYYGGSGACSPIEAVQNCSITGFLCKDGYFKSGNACKTCPANATCSGSGNDITCNPGYSLQGEVCVKDNTTCQNGKYYNGTSHVDCPAGKYCGKGGQETPIGAPGCFETCPADASGGTVTSPVSSQAATACYTVRSNQNLTDGSGRGDQTCYYNTTSSKYVNSCTIKVTACNAGYWREQDNSTTCSSTNVGEYSPANDVKKYLCSALSGAASNVTTAGKNSTAATACYNPCSNVSITNGTRVPVNTKEFYNGTSIPACTYTTSCNTGYQASGTTCVPSVYEITLNHDGGTSATSKIYLKYATGWYSNAAATTAITKVAVPTKGDSDTFSGYRSADGETIVAENGTLTTDYTVFTQNATITADWQLRTPITCAAGKYYTGTGSTCTTCTAGSFCPGIETYIGIGSPRGITTCASLGGQYTSAKAANGTSLTTTVSSAAGAAAASDCYATNVAYTSASNKAAGSQTCYLNTSTNAYTEKCKSQQVLTCVGGHYLANASDIDCTEVGIAYYSADKAITRTECPNRATESGVKTFSTTSEKVTECYLGNIWYQPVGGHSGHRRSCYHIDNASETNVALGYSYNCDVSVIVTCDGGYYDDGSYKNANGERDCKSVTDKDSYSPAQSFFTSEAAQPNQETPGSSTKLHSCPASKTISNGTALRVFATPWSANDYAVCAYKDATCDDGYRKITSGAEAKCVWDDPDTCPEGFYCPDGSDEPLECPSDKNGTVGTTEIGAKSIEQCFIEYDPYSGFKNGTGIATCNYSNDSSDYTYCHDVNAKTCNAGYYYKEAGATVCVEVTSGNYSPAPDTTQTACPIGGNGSTQFAANWNACYKNCTINIPHSATIAAAEERVFGTSATTYAACSFHVTCQTGYTVKNDNTATPTCDANVYTVTLDKNNGTGNVANSIQCTFNSGACELPATTGLTRRGYSVGTKWCTESNGGGVCYNGGTTITTNLSATGSDMTLYAIWTPNVYAVTLKHDDATVAGAPAVAYLKYATGWFADQSATLPLSKLTKAPEKTGYEFAGYVAEDKTSIVAANGVFQTTEAALKFTASNVAVNAVWSAGNTVCESGKYYAGTGATCLPCSDNHYCPGGSYATDAGKDGENACRDGGKTAAGSAASSETQCYKENLPTYVATHGAGTQKCYFDTTELAYSANCTDKYITSCDAGYWQESKAPGQAAPDCAPVGNGYYSPDVTVNRTACPNGGTTTETTAATVQRCFKTGLPYAAEFGSGTQRCYYSSGDGAAAVYNRDCDTKEINKCRGGYWLNTAISAIECSPVGENYYSETDDVQRHLCENDGKTATDTTSDPHLCFKDSETYTSEHGGGYRTCYYTSGTGTSALYETSCETPTFTYCHAGHYYAATQSKTDCVEVGYGFYSPALDLDRYSCGAGSTTATPTSDSAEACYVCPAGMVCEEPTPDNPHPKPKSCSELTGGLYPKSDEGTTSVDMCYRDCEKGEHVYSTVGHDYYGGNNTCEIEMCYAGYHKENGMCVECAENMFCPGPDPDCPDCPPVNPDDPDISSCSDLHDDEGNSLWPNAKKGATAATDCYAKCEPKKVDGGTAIPKNATEFYPTKCDYTKGKDDDDNPCDIIDGECVVTSCQPAFEMVNGKCVRCAYDDNALSFKPNTNCVVASCTVGMHPNGKYCEEDVRECTAPNATNATQTWDYKLNAYGICKITECDEGYHLSSNACVLDEQVCAVEHGVGVKTWNHKTGTWGECVATSCDAGYTNDPSLTNQQYKQCGECANKYSVLGELAASSYIRECEIASCMYQGEMYNLENNECVPICSVSGYSDETGTMKWDANRKKCVRTCNEGYSMW